MPAPRVPAPALRFRWRRKVLRLVQLLGVLLVVGVGLIVAAVWSLDRPWLRQRVRALVHTAAGIDLDYGHTEISLHGLRITDLVVLTPPRFRTLSPELLRLDVLEVGFSPRTLFRSAVTQAVLRGLTVTLVLDADDRTSISELGAEPSGGAAAATGKPAGKRTPPSQLAAKLLSGLPPLGHATIDGVAVTLLIRDEHQAVERLHATGLGLVLDTQSLGSGWQLHAVAGAPDAPKMLAIAREHDGHKTGEASAALELDVSVSPTAAHAQLALTVKNQTLWPMIHVDRLIHGEVQANFDAKAGAIELTLKQVELVDGTAAFFARVELPDAAGALPLLRLGNGTVDLQPVFGSLAANLVPLSARRAKLHFDLDRLILSRVPRLAPGGHAAVDGDFEDLTLRLGGASLTLLKGQLLVKAEPTAAQGLTLQAKVPLQELRWVQDATVFAAATLQLSANGQIDQAGAVTGDATLQLGAISQETIGAAVKPGPAEHITLREGHLSVHATELRLNSDAAPLAPTPPDKPTAAAAPPPAASHEVSRGAGHAAPEPGLVRGLAHGLARGLAHAPGHTGQTSHTGADPAHPKRVVHARLTVDGELDGIDVQRPGLRAAVDSLGISAQGELTGGAPYALDIDLPLHAFRLADGKGQTLVAGPAHFSAQLAEFYPDSAAPLHSRAELKLTADFGATHTQLTLRKHADNLDFEVTANASNLTALRPLVSVPGSVFSGDSMALALHSQGRVEHLFAADRKLSQHGELHLAHPAWKSPTGAFAAQGIDLVATTNGTTYHHSAELDLRLHGLLVSGAKVSDLHLVLTGEADVAAPALRLHLDSESPTGPKATIAATLGFDRTRKILHYDLAMKAARLGPLQPLFDKLYAVRGFDLSALDLSLGGRGAVSGVVDAIDVSGAMHFAPHPLTTAGITGTLEFGAGGLYWGDSERVVKSPRFGWRATLHHDGATQKLHGELLLDALHVEFGEHELDFSKVRDAVDVTLHGDPVHGPLELTQSLTLGELEQDLAPGYPMSGLTLRLQAARNHDGELRISALKLDNPGGGTGLDLSGHLELREGRRSMALSGTLDQKLDRLWNDHDVYVGRGALALAVSIHSSNLTRFHTQAQVRVTNGNLTLPRRGITIEGFVGEVPLIADLQLDQHGFQVLRGTPASVYSQLRYADQHPLLSGRSFISVGRIATPWFTASGLAGNLRIQHNMLSLNQFELGTRGGHISGLCLVDFSEGDGSHHYNGGRGPD